MQERKIVAATENEYLNIILNTLNTAQNGKVPDQSQVLLKLLEKYVIDSAKTFLLIPRTSRTHTADAEKCIKLIRDSASAAMPEVIKQLNTIKYIRNGGDFGILLSTFFSVYPEYLVKCSDVVKKAVVVQDPWKNQIATWVKTLLETRQEASWNNAHELLEHLSDVIPEEAADAYADYLLAQLRIKKDENHKGLHKGWVCTALAALQDKLSLVKRDLITRTLLKEFENTDYDLSMIGMCSALSRLQLTDKQRKEAAMHLHTYVVDKLPNLLDLFADHHSDTISSYMEKIFITLSTFEKEYTDIPRKSIINFLLENENAYPLRHGILTLEKWISNEQKMEFLSRLEIHPQFMKMAPLFWKWMNADKNNSTDWARRNRFSQWFSELREKLTGTISPDSPSYPQVAWLIAEGSTTTSVRTEIMNNLINQLSKYNRNASHDEVREDLHHSLALMRTWANATQLPALAKVLQSSVNINPDDPSSLKISAATAAVELAEHLRPDDSKQLRDDLLELLDGSVAKDAAKALTIYLTKIPYKQLPELMSCLALKTNIHAQLLLAGVHEYYQEMSQQAAPAFKNAM